VTCIPFNSKEARFDVTGKKPKLHRSAGKTPVFVPLDTVIRPNVKEKLADSDDFWNPAI